MPIFDSHLSILDTLSNPGRCEKYEACSKSNLCIDSVIFSSMLPLRRFDLSREAWRGAGQRYQSCMIKTFHSLRSDGGIAAGSETTAKMSVRNRYLETIRNTLGREPNETTRIVTGKGLERPLKATTSRGVHISPVGLQRLGLRLVAQERGLFTLS